MTVLQILIVLCAKYLIALPVVVALYIAWTLPARERTSFIATTVLAGIVAYGAAKLGSHFYYDPRPFVSDGIAPLIAHAADNGFPSDHMLLAATLASATVLYEKRTGLILWVVALFIGGARVLAGIHHPIDILGSALIGGAAARLADVVLTQYVFKSPDSQ